MITVYTRPSCSLCDATKVYLDKNKIDYESVDISVDAVGRDVVLGLGYTSLPVVVAGAEHWSGFRVEKLAALKTFHPGDNNGVIEG